MQPMFFGLALFGGSCAFRLEDVAFLVFHVELIVVQRGGGACSSFGLYPGIYGPVKGLRTLYKLFHKY
jgi:hypothetical protein